MPRTVPQRHLRGLAYDHIRTAMQAVTFMRGGAAVLGPLQRALDELKRLECDEPAEVTNTRLERELVAHGH